MSTTCILLSEIINDILYDSFLALLGKELFEPTGSNDEDNTTIINRLLLEEYVELQSFGHTKKFPEIYKSNKNTNIQKSQSFRTKINQ